MIPFPFCIISLPPTFFIAQEKARKCKEYTRQGYSYEYGKGVSQDKKQAVKFYAKAAELGGRYAMFALGKACHKGDGIAQDTEKALEWYKKAVEPRTAHT